VPLQGTPFISKPDFVLVERVKRKKVVSCPGQDSHNENPDTTHEPAPILFDRVIHALRLFRSSTVYRDGMVWGSYPFHPSFGSGGASRRIDQPLLGNLLSVTSIDIIDIQRLYEQIRTNEDKSVFRITLKRLSYGLERIDPEDKVIDFMIGLEALYLPDGSTELKYRWSLRIAWMLEDDTEARKYKYAELKALYDMRSSVVHGSPPGRKNPITDEKIAKLEDMLRISLRMYLDDSSRFEGSALDELCLGSSE
jgi:hypothetical protein